MKLRWGRIKLGLGLMFGGLRAVMTEDNDIRESRAILKVDAGLLGPILLTVARIAAGSKLGALCYYQSQRVQVPHI